MQAAVSRSYPPCIAMRVGHASLFVGTWLALSACFAAGASVATNGGVQVEWKDLSYSVEVGKGPQRANKPILRGLTGVAEPGHVVAIMGPTGSGKTSLLNALAGRTLASSGGNLSGDILINGEKRDEGSFRRLSAYVQQDDVMYAHQTVRETLQMAAKLRLQAADAQSGEYRDQFVGSLIQQLGLVKAADTVIGDEKTRGVSGGERKRTNLGIELISDPSVIFLDEPTSGLDSFQAESVIHTLAKLADNGRTVFVSIHQPSSAVFNMFDYLLLLSEGQAMYYGPAKKAVPYFSSLGHRCPNLFNPGDFFLDLVSIDYRTSEARNQTTETVLKLGDAFRRHWSKTGHATARPAPKKGSLTPIARMRSLSDLLASGVRPITPPPAPPLGPRPKYAVGWGQQFSALYGRAAKEVARDTQSIVVRGITTMIFAVALSVAYSKKDIDAQKAIQDKTGAMFFMAVNQAFGMIGPVLGSFPTERGIVLRERMARSYRLSAYYLAKVWSEMPVVCGLPIVFGCITYPALRLRRDLKHFGIFLVIMVLNSVCATSLGILVSAATSSFREANSIAPVIMVISLLFGGFYVNSQNMHPFLVGLSQLSFIRHTFAALSINEFQGLRIPCAKGAKDCVTGGDQVLARLSLDGLSIGKAILGQTALIGLFNVLALVALRRNMPSYEVLKSGQVPQPPCDGPMEGEGKKR